MFPLKEGFLRSRLKTLNFFSRNKRDERHSLAKFHIQSSSFISQEKRQYVSTLLSISQKEGNSLMHSLPPRKKRYVWQLQLSRIGM